MDKIQQIENVLKQYIQNRKMMMKMAKKQQQELGFSSCAGHHQSDTDYQVNMECVGDLESLLREIKRIKKEK